MKKRLTEALNSNTNRGDLSNTGRGANTNRGDDPVTGAEAMDNSNRGSETNRGSDGETLTVTKQEKAWMVAMHKGGHRTKTIQFERFYQGTVHPMLICSLLLNGGMTNLPC